MDSEYTILKYPDPRLRETSLPVLKYDRALREFLKQFARILDEDKDGMGLSAPQIGVLKRIIAIKHQQRIEIMINPVIKRYYAEEETDKEGCLSFPDLWLEIKRPRTIDLVYWDKHDKYKSLMLTGTLARCVQHEVEHLNGTLFIDKIADEAQLQILREWEKVHI